MLTNDVNSEPVLDDTALTRESPLPRAHAPVIPERPDEPLASSPQLYRLHKLGLLPEALGEGVFITREQAWELLRRRG